MEGIGIEVLEVVKIHVAEGVLIVIAMTDGITVVLRDTEVGALGGIEVHKDIKAQVIVMGAEVPTPKNMIVEAPTPKNMKAEAPTPKDMKAEAPTQQDIVEV